jgi:glutamyl-tRNA synthetase
MIRHFSLEGVNNAPASFDCKKLSAFQDRYMQQMPLDRKTDMVLPYLQKAGLVGSPPAPQAVATLQQVLQAAGDRIKVAGDILDHAAFFQADDQMPYDDKAFDKRIRKPPEAAGLLAKFKERLASAEKFDAEHLENLLEAFVQSEAIKKDEIIHALRVAVTGKAVGFGLYDSLAVLGKQRSLARIDSAFARVN